MRRVMLKSMELTGMRWLCNSANIVDRPIHTCQQSTIRNQEISRGTPLGLLSRPGVRVRILA